MAGLDLTKHRPAVAVPRSVVEAVAASRPAGYRPRVGALAEEMALPMFRARTRAIIQFIKDWNTWPADRAEMLDGPAPEGDPFDVACIAAVVRALTARDRLAAPEWVHHHRADPARLITGHSIDSDYGRLIAADAPAECAQHGVYFEAAMLDR